MSSDLAIKRALAMLTDQCNELEGRIGVLATAIRDIERESGPSGHWDPADQLDAIRHICRTAGVREAMNPSA